MNGDDQMDKLTDLLYIVNKLNEKFASTYMVENGMVFEYCSNGYAEGILFLENPVWDPDFDCIYDDENQIVNIQSVITERAKKMVKELNKVFGD